MKSQKELNLYEIDTDYDDIESIIRSFLTYSALNRMSEFNFESAFGRLQRPIYDKLIEHAQVDYEVFEIYHQDIFCYDTKNLREFTLSSDYINITVEDVLAAIIKMHYERSQEAFNGKFDNLINLNKRIDNQYQITELENIILFDEVIHAQHVTGDVFCDVDIDSIKSDLDIELLEIIGIKQTA